MATNFKSINRCSFFMQHCERLCNPVEDCIPDKTNVITINKNKMRKLNLYFCSLCILLTSFRPPDEKTTTGSNLKTVTVYRNGAELTHTATVYLSGSANELIIEGLSSNLDVNSIQIHCSAAVTILGTEFSNTYLHPENISPAVKKLKDSSENIVEQLDRLSIQISTSEELLGILKINRDVKGAQAGLSVIELNKLMAYYKQKSIEVKNDLLTLKAKEKKLREGIDKITAQIDSEQKKNTTSGGRITLQISVAVAGNQEFTISYITRNAYWTPYYDIKAKDINSPMNFIYKAKISQATGIDWKKVKLSLSTSTPKQYGNAPLFQKWFLGYIDPIFRIEKNLNNSLSNSLSGQVSGVTVTGYGMSGKSKEVGDGTTAVRGISTTNGSNEPLYVVNGAPIVASDYNKIDPQSIKSVEVLKDAVATAVYGARGVNGVIVITLKDGLEDYVTVSSSELEISYDIDLPYDVPTNGKPQIAVLKELTIPATFKYYAVPKLDKSAYLLAEIADWQSLNLIPGEANIIFEGTYIGKSFIDPANTSDTLNLTMGTDSRVIIKREKLTDFSSVKFLGSNKLQTMTYELTIKNNKKEAVNILVKDQYPISTNKEIEVALIEISQGQNNQEMGIINWRLTIPPGKTEKIKMSYSVKYPKGKAVNLN